MLKSALCISLCIYLFVRVSAISIMALTLLGSEGQMVGDCFVALHVSMFGFKCL